MSSDDEYVYGCSDDEELSQGDGDGDEIDEFNENELDEIINVSEEKTSEAAANYTILKEKAINQLQNNEISTVSNNLSISRGEAFSLLRYYKWRVEEAIGEWFADENRVREAIGLSPLPQGGGKQGKTKTNNNNNNNLSCGCGICFDDFSKDNPRIVNNSSSCASHQFCTDCWKTYIHISINDGPGCLTLRCPDPKCKVLVDLELIQSLVSNEDKEKYQKFLERSYVEDNRKRKWCPAPDCENWIEYDNFGSIYDVTCKCDNKFCWNCNEESHSPVDCEMVKRWALKNASEAENTLWVLAFTKPCPKCKKPIEKNSGCNHMTCAEPCRHQFCWLCFGDWNNHLTCNRFASAGHGDNETEDDKIRNNAKRYLKRYEHYFERWVSNNKSCKKAKVDLGRARTDQIGKLMRIYGLPESRVKILTDAWEQIAECRRVLKWTYTYGYYMKEDDYRKDFFEYLQGAAESELERLHHCIEQEVVLYIADGKDVPSKTKTEFEEFRSKLVNLTRTTKNSFETFLTQLTNGLDLTSYR